MVLFLVIYVAMATRIEGFVLSHRGKQVTELSDNSMNKKSQYVLGDNGTGGIDSPLVSRWKRAGKIIDIAVLVGRRAVKYLLKDSKPVPSSGPDRVFEKRGGFIKAAKEFYDLGPIKINDYGTKVTGIVGDKEVIFRRGDLKNSPSISIIHWQPTQNTRKYMEIMDTFVYKP